MKIIKLTEDKFAFENDECEIFIVDWNKLIKMLDDICEHLDRDISDIVLDLAQFKNGAVLKL